MVKKNTKYPASFSRPITFAASSRRPAADPLPRGHIAVVVIDDAVAVEEGGGLGHRAGGIGAAHFLDLADHGLLDLVADTVGHRQ